MGVVPPLFAQHLDRSEKERHLALIAVSRLLQRPDIDVEFFSIVQQWIAMRRGHAEGFDHCRTKRIKFRGLQRPRLVMDLRLQQKTAIPLQQKK